MSPSTMHVVPDELLELVFMRLPTSLHLVRAACTCKRWRRVIGDGGFLRRFRGLHPWPVVAGRYRIDVYHHRWRPSGRNPVFSPSTSAVGLRPHHFSLDFLLACDGGVWDLADSRGSIPLLVQGRAVENVFPMQFPFPHGVVCDPMTRRCSRVIAPLALPHDRQFIGAFLLDGGDVDDETGVSISLTNFRIIAVLYDNGIARSYVFSSGNGGGWNFGWGVLARPESCILFAGHVGESVYWTTIHGEILLLDKDAEKLKFCSALFPDNLYGHVLFSKSGITRCRNGRLRVALLIRETYLRVFIQADGSDTWLLEKSVNLQRQLLTSEVQDDGACMLKKIVSVEEGSVVLGPATGVGLVSVDLATMDLARVEGTSHGPAHTYHLPWPPTIRACLP